MNMVINNEKFDASAEKRQILVVDDDFINRELLGEILKQDYNVLYAENGMQALEIIREHYESLSLILLPADAGDGRERSPETGHGRC